MASLIYMLVLVATISAVNVTDKDDTFVTAMNKFGWTFYQTLATSSSTGNLFVSTFSIFIGIGMVCEGAKDNTLFQLKNAMFIGDMDSDEDLGEACSDILDELEGIDGNGILLYVANGLFGAQSYTFLDPFVNKILYYFGADVQRVDFGGDAADKINSWVADNTDNIITRILEDSDISPDTRLVLLDIIYFKGLWTTPFQVDATNKADFYITSQKNISVWMMRQKVSLLYGVNERLNSRAISVPYVGGNISMVIILPLNSTGCQTLEQDITSEDLMNINDRFSMMKIDVDLHLPRFILNEKTYAQEILQRMGISDAFQMGIADLSDMDGTNNLYISSVLQNALIEVNEEGSKAAAATAVVIQPRMAPAFVTPPKDFVVDHPCLFFLREETKKIILFLGRLSIPPEA